MSTSIVIPARIGSTRLPGKILKMIGDKPLLQHTWERALLVPSVNEVIVAVDDEAVKDLVESWGGTAYMTDPACASGTERIVSILDKVSGDFIINLQADECFIAPPLLESISLNASNADIVTPVYKIKELADLEDPNVVKAVVAANGKALYFSRSTVPYLRDVPKADWLKHADYWWHIGVYGYKRAVLENYHTLPPSPLEQQEKLEQLRFLEAGYTIATVETKEHTLAIDTQADLDKAIESLPLAST